MKISLDLPSPRPVDLIVDNSILSDMTCSTRGAMRHVLGLTTPVDAVELVSGSAVHEALARWLVTAGDPDAALRRFDRVYKPWAEEHVPLLDKEGKPNRLAWKPVRRILAHWLRGHDFDRFQMVVEPEHVEVPVWAVMGSVDGNGVLNAGREIYKKLPTVYFVALLDFIGRQRKLPGGGLWSNDWKSSGSMGPWYRERQEDTAQFTGQIWAAAERDMQLAGVFVHGIELRALNTSDRRCPAHGVPYVQCALEHCATMLFPVTRTKNEIVAWERTARILTRRYIRLRDEVRDVQDVAELPMEGRFMGQCGRCTFRQFCRLGRTKQAARDFVVQRWEPLAHAQRRGGVKDTED